MILNIFFFYSAPNHKVLFQKNKFSQIKKIGFKYQSKVTINLDIQKIKKYNRICEIIIIIIIIIIIRQILRKNNLFQIILNKPMDDSHEYFLNPILQLEKCIGICKIIIIIRQILRKNNLFQIILNKPMDDSHEYFLNPIQQLQKKRRSIQQCQSGILLYGMTGAGKSTLVHYLLKDPKLVAYQDKDEEKIKLKCEGENQFSHIKIGGGKKSETKSQITISHQGLIFRDLPGFVDNREDKKSVINQDIFNQFYFKTVLQNTKQYKILLVVKKSDLSGRATLFTECLEHFKKQFENKLSSIKDNCLLIFSQSTKSKQNILKKQLKEYLTEIKTDEDNIQFLSYLLKKDKIAYFYSPKSSGKICYQNSQQILKKIDSIKYLSNQRNSYQFKFSANSNEKLLDSTPRIKSQLIKVIQKFDKLVEQQIKAAYTKNDSLEIPQLKQQMIKLHNKLKGININKEQSNIFKQLQQIFESYSQLKTFLLKIKQILDFLLFLAKLVGGKFYQFKDIFQTIQNSIKITISSTNKIVMVNQSQVGYLTQKNQIDSLQIQDIIIQNLNMFNTFIFISDKMNLFCGIKAPSKNLVLFAKFIQTYQVMRTKIDLKGDDGQQIQPKFVINRDGNAGNNGKHGGSCWISVDQQIKGLGIQLDLRGGKGGDGQNCQFKDIKQNIVNLPNEIQDDPNNDEKDKVFLKKRESYGLDKKETLQQITHCIKEVATFNEQVLETYSTATTKAWNKYYKLKPGQGGKPGKQGQLFYQPKKNAPKQNKICVSNSDADAGKNGTLKLDIWEGKYVREVILARLRQGGKTFQDDHLKQLVVKEMFFERGDEMAMENVTQEAIQTAINAAIEKMGKKYVTQEDVMFVISEILKKIVGRAGSSNARQSLGQTMAVRGACSAISAYISDHWKEKITHKGMGYFDPPILIQSEKLVAKSKFSLDRQYFKKNFQLFLQQQA